MCVYVLVQRSNVGRNWGKRLALVVVGVGNGGCL